MRVVRILTTLIRFHITHHYNAITHYNTAKYTFHLYYIQVHVYIICEYTYNYQ